MTINTGRFLNERIIALICTVTLPVTANSRETVDTTWSGPSGQLRNMSNITISNANVIANGVFQSTLSISGFIPATHNGNYICNANVVPSLSSSHVVGSNATGMRHVMVSG